MSSNFVPNQWIWFSKEDGSMAAGQIVSFLQDGATVRMVDGEISQAPGATMRPMHPTSIQGVEDMITLGDLHEASLLHNITIRHLQDNIYTYTGNILVGVNPYKSMAIYAAENIRKYQGKQLGHLPPHIYAIANEAYYTMVKTRRDQCVVISGESGAGKTESTKLILNFLTCVSSKKSLVQDQILDASPILEAFGNAKTVRNDNSSRFGKFLEVQFGTDGNIAGALTLQYLLEKSRIVFQAQEERNYHIFYFLLAGATTEEKKSLRLTQPQDFRYLNQSGCYQLKNVNDTEAMAEVREAFRTLNFQEFAADIYKNIAAVLHLGNISFTKGVQGGMDGVTISSSNEVEIAAELLGIDSEKLGTLLINRTSVTRGETFVTPLNMEQASDARDALAKAIYGRMFNWIVSHINEITRHNDILSFVGVLDIFGFEDFKVNSFEQFCINYANERLQYYFNQHIFKLEQEEYTKEEINWSKIEFVDNQGTIDLISKKPVGLLGLLDEESNFPKGSDQTLLEKFHQNHASNPAYSKPKTQQPIFGVCHYAGEVTYQIEGFLEKNKDTLRQDIQDVLKDSSQSLIALYFNPEGVEEYADKSRSRGSSSLAAIPSGSGTLHRPSSPGGVKGSSKSQTCGYQFSTSLNNLISTLTMCNPYFVRCIKPNTTKTPKKIDPEMVLAQLRYSGMLETIRVRKAGFTGRTLFEEFLKRYGIVNPDARAPSKAESCKKIILICGPGLKQGSDWQIGITKVFMKGNVESALEALRAEKIMVYIVRIQAFLRMARCKTRLRKFKKYAVTAQRLIRGYLGRSTARKHKKAILIFQSVWRGRQVRFTYENELTRLRLMQRGRKAQEEREKQAQNEAEALERRATELPVGVKKYMATRESPLYGPYEKSEYCKLAVIVPDRNQASREVAGSVMDLAGVEDDGHTTWTKFTKIFFKDPGTASYSRSPIAHGLLSLPTDLMNLNAIMMNRILITLTSSDCEADVVFHAINFIADQVSSMKYLNIQMPKGLVFSDELLCQCITMTYNNDDEEVHDRAWTYLAFFLGFFAPSKYLSSYLKKYLEEAPSSEMADLCFRRMSRAMAQIGRKSTNITSMEIWAFFSLKPIIAQAMWPDGASTFFELDPQATPEEIMMQICLSKGLSMAEGYAMKILFQGNEETLAPNEVVLDKIAIAEQYATKTKEIPPDMVFEEQPLPLPPVKRNEPKEPPETPSNAQQSRVSSLKPLTSDIGLMPPPTPPNIGSQIARPPPPAPPLSSKPPSNAETTPPPVPSATAKPMSGTIKGMPPPVPTSTTKPPGNTGRPPIPVMAEIPASPPRPPSMSGGPSPPQGPPRPPSITGGPSPPQGPPPPPMSGGSQPSPGMSSKTGPPPPPNVPKARSTAVKPAPPSQTTTKLPGPAAPGPVLGGGAPPPPPPPSIAPAVSTQPAGKSLSLAEQLALKKQKGLNKVESE